MAMRRFARLSLLLLVVAAAPALVAEPASAAAPTSGSCAGQLFSSHAGLGAAHIGETVGTMVSGAAREPRGEFGATISGTSSLPREDCGL